MKDNSNITKAENRKYSASNFPELPSSHGKEEKNVMECIVQLFTQGKHTNSSRVVNFNINLSYEFCIKDFE